MKRKITRSTSFSLENSWATRNSTETVLTFVLQNNLTKYLSNNGNNIITKLIRHIVIIIKLIVIKKSIYLSNYKLYNIWKTYIDRSSIKISSIKISEKYETILKMCGKGKERYTKREKLERLGMFRGIFELPKICYAHLCCDLKI